MPTFKHENEPADALRRLASERAIKLKRDKIFLSLFMPKGAAKELRRAYSYLRSVDDLVDADPPQRAEYFKAKERLLRAISGEKSGDRVVDRFAEIAVRRGFRREWFDAFFNSMEMDLRNARYETRADLEQYVSGVSDAPAEMICSICGFRGKAREGLSSLARSIEYLNLLRDLGEDLAGGRNYIPLEELKRYGLRDASEGAARENKAGFMKLVKAELARYDGIAREADEGLKRMPAGYGLPLLTVSSVYQWEARRIARNPYIIYEANRRNFRPSKARVMVYLVQNAFDYVPGRGEKRSGPRRFQTNV